MSEKKTETIKVVPNPEHTEVVIEEEKETSKFPKFPKYAKKVIIGAVGVAIAGYVASRVLKKDEDDSDETNAWTDYLPQVNIDPAAASE